MLREKFFSILLVAACIAPCTGYADPLYTVSLLPDRFIGNDINNAGQMAGQFLTDTGFKAALYRDNSVIQLAIPNDNVSIAEAINEAGTVTGFSSSATSGGYAFVYRDGALTLLADGTNGMGINDKGVVVGEAQRTTGTGSTGFMYKNGTLTELGTLEGGNRALALDINNRGQIVGETRTGTSPLSSTLPFLYQHGKLHVLDTLFDGGMNGAQAINDAGLIAGYSTSPDGTQHAVLYDHGTVRDAGTFGANLIEVTDINEDGTFVGDSYRASTSRRFGFIYLAGVLTELSTLVDPAEGWVIEDALGINDLGQIVAVGCRTDSGYCNGVLLNLTSAVPEPHHAVLLLPGLLVVAMAQRRRTGRPARSACRHQDTLVMA